MRLPAWKDVAQIPTILSTLQQPWNNHPAGSAGSLAIASERPELPGGSPFSLCKQSSSTDLFNITSVEVTHQPIYIDDVFLIHIYGSFQQSFKPNATMKMTVDCGSHCDDYGVPPEDRAGETGSFNFCDFTQIEQPTGGKKLNDTCRPEAGYALISAEAYIFPMFIHVPVWYNFTFNVNTAEGDRVFCLTTEVCLKWRDEKKNEHYPGGPYPKCNWPR